MTNINTPTMRRLIEMVVAEAASGYFYVLSKDGYARVVNEDDPALITAWDEGWEVEWDSARSVEQGLKWAAEQKGLKPEPAPREKGSPFWFVFSRAGLARAVPEDDVDLGAMKKDGWKLEFDSARSEAQGLERAREQLHLKPWDHFRPLLMTEPKTLYRSVSLPELLDIAKTGKIMGGGNLFNEFDPRRYVFFGDEISPELIFQGADTERQTQRLLSDHAIHGKFKKLNAKLTAARRQIVQGAREHIGEINERRRAAGHPPLPIDEKFLDEFVKYGGSEHKVTELLPRDPKDTTYKLWQTYQKLRGQMSPLQAEYNKIFRATHRAHADKVAALPITSAIVETRPLSGGLEYSAKAGSLTGMELPEFGFERGAVTLDDVIKVYWVKGREIESTTSPKAILPTLAKLGLQ